MIKVLMQSEGQDKPVPIDSAMLSTTIDTLEQTRRDLQLGMLHGWGHWVNTNLLDMVLMPSAARFRTEICHIPSNVCLSNTVIGSSFQIKDQSVHPNANLFSLLKTSL